MKPAERNYPVHDKELLAMRYALIKFRVYLLGEQSFAVYTDYASLRTATKSPHLSRLWRAVCRSSPSTTSSCTTSRARTTFSSTHCLGVPITILALCSGRQVIDDEDESDDHCAVCAASGINLTSVSLEMDLRDEFVAGYADDAVYANILAYLRSPSDETLGAHSRNTLNQIDRYHLDGDLLFYNNDHFDAHRGVVPNDDDLRARIIHEFHESPMGANLGREKTFVAMSREFYWPPVKSSQASLHPLPIATEAWRSISMDFVFGLPPDADGRNGVLVVVDRFMKMVHLTPVSDTVTAAETAAHFVDCVLRHHGLPELVVSDRDPRFTSAFWTALFQLLGTKMLMSTAAHPETDGQPERVNRVLEDVLRSYATSFTSWSKCLPLAEFALNNAEHASTGMAPFFANNARLPCVPALFAVGHPTVSGAFTLVGDNDDNDVDDVVTPWTARTLIDPGNTGTPIAANYTPKSPARQVDNAAVSAFVQRRESIARFVRDALQDAVDKQKENADKPGRKNMTTFKIGEQVLLSADSIRSSAVTNIGASKLAPHFIGPFRVTEVNGEAYTLDIPTSLQLHPTFYVGRLKKYYPATVPSATDPPASTLERRVNPPPDAPPTLPTAAAVPPSAAPRRHGAPTPESAPVTPDSTCAPLQAPFSPTRPEQSPPQPPPERPEHDSSQLRHPPGSPRRTRYHREPLQPIVDSVGQTCWIVDRLVAHEDPPRATSRTRARTSASSTRGIPPARRYRVCWLRYPPDEDTRRPRSVLLRNVPDVVLEYEGEIANKNTVVADPAATKTATESATDADPAASGEREPPMQLILLTVEMGCPFVSRYVEGRFEEPRSTDHHPVSPHSSGTYSPYQRSSPSTSDVQATSVVPAASVVDCRVCRPSVVFS
ncbi:unnamed protein product [Phytophthora fragariaefolia]|uniref:Unnamed protein product n=1 Tax=Phytophthora fragariaefolia TaxID=1490495 RepID=A0A9W7CNB3_9STRA|nr:unnamed protein product [Phytophthora fragariaefolia]